MPEDRAHTRQAETRKLAAIMFTDIVGFSRQMGADEFRMLRLLDIHNGIIQQAVSEQHGTVIKTIGDAFLVDFPSVVNAVQCAQHIQAQLRAYNAQQDSTQQIHLRIGIHLGDIVQREGDVFGDGVNTASRLQTLAEPDTVCISHKVYEEVAKKLSLGTVVSLGRPKLKNLAERFEVYALLAEPPKGLRQALQVQRWKLRPWQRLLQVMAAVLMLGLMSVGTLVFQRHYRSSPPGLLLPDKPSIVVLPFVHMGGDPSQDYLSDGVTEDLTTDLSKVSGLFVISRNSAFTYKDKAVKVQDVSREMGVRYVLEGSVRKAGDQLRITAQLIDGTTGGHVWSERYDRLLRDIFALQDEITQQIVTVLRVEMQEAELERVRRVPTENLNAYDSLLRGWEYYHRTTKEANAQARQLFERAIELDPTYALAYTTLGFTHQMDWGLQWSQDPHSLERAAELTHKAIVLDHSLPQAHMLLSYVYQLKLQLEPAITEAKQAIALDPNDAYSHAALAEALSWTVESEEAIALAEQAMRLNPQYPANYLMSLGRAYFVAGRTEEAITALKKALTVNRDFLPPHVLLIGIYSETNREAEARAEVAEVLRISPNFSVDGLGRRAPYPAQVLARYLTALRKAGLK